MSKFKFDANHKTEWLYPIGIIVVLALAIGLAFYFKKDVVVNPPTPTPPIVKSPTAPDPIIIPDYDVVPGKDKG